MSKMRNFLIIGVGWVIAESVGEVSSGKTKLSYPFTFSFQKVDNKIHHEISSLLVLTGQHYCEINNSHIITSVPLDTNAERQYEEAVKQYKAKKSGIVLP